MNRPVHPALHAQLFETPFRKIFAIIDGAAEPALVPALDKTGLPNVCLLRGELAEDIRLAGPHLVELEPDHAFTQWLLTEGIGKHWGIFILTNTELRTLRQHCRALLWVYGSDGEPLFFRFYDPRVLRVYLPTCTNRELQTFFGPVKRFLVENAPADAIQRFESEDGTLITEAIALIAN